jgi:hypothetical protein
VIFAGSGKELVGDHRAEDVIVLSNDQKEFCLKRGFQIYEAMKSQGVPPKEMETLHLTWSSRWLRQRSLPGMISSNA